MLALFSSVVLFLLSKAHGRSDYPDYVPNARRVIIDGTTTVGLGHASLTAGSVSVADANPFGIDVENAAIQFGNNAQAIWTAVCDLDSDGDGILNKDELCDPGCNNPGVEVDCLDGLELTHPGGIEAGNLGTIVHAWLMIFAWVILAPYGVLRAIFFKKSGNPAWFWDHKVALSGAVAFTLIGFISILIQLGPLPIELAFESIGEGSSGHVLLGLVVIIISIIQPISGMLRPHIPHKGEEKSFNRKFWEYQHQFTGRIGIVLALITVNLGLPLLYNDAGEALGIVLIVILAIVGIGAIVFVLLFRDEQKPKNDNEVTPPKDAYEKTDKVEAKASKEKEIVDEEKGEEIDAEEEKEEVDAEEGKKESEGDLDEEEVTGEDKESRPARAKAGMSF